MQWRLDYIVRSCTLVVMLLLISGCGPSGNNIEVSGLITLDNKPLPEGTITILPLDQGKANSAEITDGSYTLQAEAGIYKVEISRMVSTGQAVSDPDYGTETEMTESIPSRYNSSSQLRMEINIGDNEPQNFALESR